MSVTVPMYPLAIAVAVMMAGMVKLLLDQRGGGRGPRGGKRR
jgi:hypothetical protein